MLQSNQVCEKRVVLGTFPWKRTKKPEFRRYFNITPPKKKFGARGWHKKSFLKIRAQSDKKSIFKIKQSLGKKFLNALYQLQTSFHFFPNVSGSFFSRDVQDQNWKASVCMYITVLFVCCKNHFWSCTSLEKKDPKTFEKLWNGVWYWYCCSVCHILFNNHSFIWSTPPVSQQEAILRVGKRQKKWKGIEEMEEGITVLT